MFALVYVWNFPWWKICQITLGSFKKIWILHPPSPIPHPRDSGLLVWNRIENQFLKASQGTLMGSQGWELLLYFMSLDDLIYCSNAINMLTTSRFMSLALTFSLSSGLVYLSALLTSSIWSSNRHLNLNMVKTELFIFNPKLVSLPVFSILTNGTNFHQVTDGQ